MYTGSKKEKKIQLKPLQDLVVQQKTGGFQLQDNRLKNKSQETIQRVISMKGDGEAERSKGSLLSLRTEVRNTITKNKPSDMLDTISQLEQSIDSREKEQARKPKGTPKYLSEQYRIDQEKILLNQLNTAYRNDLATRRQAKAAAKATAQQGAPKGFKVVGKSGKAK